MSPVMRGCPKCGKQRTALSSFLTEDGTMKTVEIMGPGGAEVVREKDLANYKARGYTMLDGSPIKLPDPKKENAKKKSKSEKSKG